MSDTDDSNQNALKPAHTTRLTELVDTALDVLESNMISGKSEVRQKAADSVLDRAGLTKAQARSSAQSGEAIPAEAVAQVLKGLAHVFGSKGPSEHQRDVTEPVNKEQKSAKGTLARHTEPSEAQREASRTAKRAESEAEAAPSEARKTVNEDRTEEYSEKAGSSGLPNSLLKQYGGA